jgi:transglutaminase/protease-like cytokinesis protein 3
MKTILKIIFFGIIAGVTYKYLNERNINIIEKCREAIEWVELKAKEIEKSSDEKTSPSVLNSNETHSTDEIYNSAPSYNENASSPSYHPAISQPEIQRGIQLSESAEEADAEEYIIAEKTSSRTPRFSELDEYAKNAPSQSEGSLETLAHLLAAESSNDLEKTRLIFTWIATHIAYDDNGFNTGNYSDTKAESVLKYRVSVCQGYADLFQALGKLAGMEIVTITGWSKGITYRPGSTLTDTDHAWNAVKIDGQWKLFDVTWAAGFGKGVNGRLVSTMQFDDYWFDVRPDEFIFSHLPSDEKWQLNDTRISKVQFERLPFVSSLFFKMGFNGSYCYPSALNGIINELPEAYYVKGDIRMVSMPYDKRIRPGKAIKVRVKSDKAIKIAFCNNGRITEMAKDGNEFSAVIRTTTGSLSLMANFGGDAMTYDTFLEYVVE